MAVDPARTDHKAEYEGERYVFFCSAGCKAKFDADPVHYSALAAHAASP
jgi:Cu+-exporting ATPase